MSNTDSIRSLDPETSAQVMEVVNDLDLHLDAENKAASAVFGGARKRSLKEPSRRDSPTLPWRNPLRLSAGGSGAATPQARSPSPPKRSESPDIGTILARTPRPRKTSIATPSSSKKRLSHTSPKSEHLQSLMSDYADFMEDESDGEGGSESDSSIDIHTPLPHLMFRDGLLSPRSKLLPQSTTPFSMYSLQEEDNADPSGSVLSFASTAGSVTTKSGLQRDPRDTQRRRQRHRDGRLLKAGMGLTTGLGWSDSEDEDAPSALTRRLIHTTLERKRSGSVASGTRPSSTHESVSRLASPGPPSSPPLSRKLHSFSNLRSASVSYSSNTPSPLSPGFGPGSGPRVPRGRAVSTTTPPIARTVSSPLKPAVAAPAALSPRMRSDSDANPSLLREKLVTSPVPISQLPTAPKSPSTRKRAESSASTASVATTSTSLASISIESLRSAATPTASTDSLPSSNTHPMRKRTESSASNSTTTTSVSAGSSYSQNSSSTSVPSSASSGYRPLHLPRAAGLTGPKPAVIPPRSRTQSHSALPLPSSFVRRTTSGSTFSGVLPAGAPPTLRQRPVPAGARSQPQPRTGTGMVYRTSSYTSLHEAGSRMRSASVVASQS